LASDGKTTVAGRNSKTLKTTDLNPQADDKSPLRVDNSHNVHIARTADLYTVVG